MNMRESVTEFFEVLPPFFPSPTSSSVRVGGLVVVVGSCGGTDSGTSASPPSSLSSPFLVCCEWMLHEKPQASILLEVDHITNIKRQSPTSPNLEITSNIEQSVLCTNFGNILYQQIEAMSLLQLMQIGWAFTANIYINIINIGVNRGFVEIPVEQQVLQFMKSKSVIINVKQ